MGGSAPNPLFPGWKLLIRLISDENNLSQDWEKSLEEL
jgi:hypothetical protein